VIEENELMRRSWPFYEESAHVLKAFMSGVGAP
jgi:hypothetical protein